MQRTIEKKRNQIEAIENIVTMLNYEYESLKKGLEKEDNELKPWYQDRKEVYDAVFKVLERML